MIWSYFFSAFAINLTVVFVQVKIFDMPPWLHNGFEVFVVSAAMALLSERAK